MAAIVDPQIADDLGSDTCLVVRSLGDDEYEVAVGGAMAYVSGHNLRVQARMYHEAAS